MVKNVLVYPLGLIMERYILVVTLTRAHRKVKTTEGPPGLREVPCFVPQIFYIF